MKFLDTSIRGAHLVEFEPNEDQRGFFARTWSRDEFKSRGLSSDFSEHSLSFNHLRGTLRGMHYQVAPHEETKLVMCVRGSVYDVIVDLRDTSDTHLEWFATELSIDNCRILYEPSGVAHGFMTLEDNSYVHYQISGNYDSASARGFRWDDPRFNIEWPFKPTVISDRDRDYVDYQS